MENFQSVISKKGIIISTVVGTSMYPLLRQRVDTVLLKKIERPLKKYDVVLFQRDSGKYVLHRVLKAKAGKYVICGDNQWKKEYTVKDENMVAIMEGFYRKEKYISTSNFWYKIYSRLAVFLRPWRFVKYCIKYVFRQIFNGGKENE